MIIHTTGKIKRAFIYTDAGDKEDEPAMVIYRPQVKGKCAIIPLSCAFKYNEPKTKQELAEVFNEVQNIAQALDFPLDGQSFARIAHTIQDGLDQLVSMPPRPQETKTHVGDAVLSANGEKFSSPVMM